MHLWPSLKIRDSFKLGYLKKVEWNLHRMKSDKKSSNNQKLLDNQRDSDQGNADAECSDSKSHGCSAICRDLLMIFTCCYCCGACHDEEEK